MKIALTIIFIGFAIVVGSYITIPAYKAPTVLLALGTASLLSVALSQKKT